MWQSAGQRALSTYLQMNWNAASVKRLKKDELGGMEFIGRVRRSGKRGGERRNGKRETEIYLFRRERE